MKKIIFIIFSFISVVGFGQTCPTQQSRVDSIVACKARIKNIPNGAVMKVSTNGNVVPAVAGTDYSKALNSVTDSSLRIKAYNATFGSNKKSLLDSCILFGNSVTQGTRFSTPLCNYINTIEVNKGIGSTKLVSGTNAFTTRFSEIPRKTVGNNSNYRYLFLDYGINDCAAGDPVSTFSSTLRYCIDTIINRGWKPQQIVIVSPSYCSRSDMQPAFKNLKRFSDSCIAIAKSKGTQYANTYDYMLENGGNSLLYDSIHPTIEGGRVMAMGIIQSLNGGVGTASTLSATQDIVAGGGLHGTNVRLVGNISAPSWALNGIRNQRIVARVKNTTSSGSIEAAHNVFGGDTLDSAFPVTITTYYNTFFTRCVAGTNTTISNNYSFFADGPTLYNNSAFFISGGSIFFNGAQGTIGTNTGHAMRLITSNAVRVNILSSGLVGMGPTPPTPTANLHLSANTAANAALNISPFTSNVTSPNNGDVWNNTANFKIRIGGVTYSLTADTTVTLSGQNFGSIGAGLQLATTSITLPGCVPGKIVLVGATDAAYKQSAAPISILYTGRCNGTNTALLMATNPSNISSIDPDSADFTLKLLK